MSEHQQLHLDGMHHSWSEGRPQPRRGVSINRNRFLTAQALRIDDEWQRLEFVSDKLENPSREDGAFEVRTAEDFDLVVWVNTQARKRPSLEDLRAKTIGLATAYLDTQLADLREQAASLHAQIDEASQSC